MIVDCPSCGATYNISDEKVRGRRVRVRCKNCSGPIIVDGEQIDADDATRVYQPSFDPNTVEDTRVYRPQLEPNTYEETDESTRVMTIGGGQTEPAPGAWTVNVSDADQRTMTLEEIVDTYNSGFITEEAFVWRDGMADWLPLMQVEDIRSAIESNQATHVVKPAVMRAQARRSAVNPPTPIAYSAPAAAPPRAHIAAAPESSVEYAPPPPRALPSSPEPARLRGGRPAAQDLFGAIATAGSEQELLSSSSLPIQDSRDKKTGARNESSVLFSLNTVRAGVGPTSAPPRGLGAAPPPPPTAAEILGMDASGALPGVDMNAALATAPIAEPPPQRITLPPARERMDTLPPTGRRRMRPLMIAAVVLVAGAMLGALVTVLRARPGGDARVASPATAEAPRTAEPVATAPPASAAEPAPAAPTSAAPSEPTPAPPAAAPAPAPAPPEPQQPALPAPGPAPKAMPGRPAPQPRPEKPAKPEGASKGDQKIVLEEEGSEKPAPAEPKSAPKEEAPAEAPPDPERPPFDMSAAKAALESAAASAASCKSADGPSGRGKVQVTFSPSGRVTSANVVEGAFGGTPVGGCVAKLFRGAKVPAFSGDPVTVAKAFTIPE